MKSTQTSHRAWIVLFTMLLAYAGSIGILANCCGVLFAAIREDMGFCAGDLSVYYMIRSLVSALSMGITTKLFFKYRSGFVLAVLGFLYAISIGMMCAFTEIWQWYLAAVFSGIGMSCVMVVIPLVLSSWFPLKSGLVIGITLSASGIASALFSPVCSRFIAQFGWRVTAVIMALIGFALVVLPSLFLPGASLEKAENRGADRSENGNGRRENRNENKCRRQIDYGNSQR